MPIDRVTVVSPDPATVKRISPVLQGAGFDLEPDAGDPRGGPVPCEDSDLVKWVLLDRRTGDAFGPASLPGSRADSPESPAFTPATLEQVERKHLAATLDHTGGNKRQAALLLGIARSTLQQKIRRYELDRGGTE